MSPASEQSSPDASSRGQARFVSLFWRLLIPNVAVLLAAGVILWVQPANGRILALAGGVLAMTLINAVLMRRAFAPLGRGRVVGEDGLARLRGDAQARVADARAPWAPGRRHGPGRLVATPRSLSPSR